MTSEAVPAATLIAECQRLLNESGWQGTLRDDLKVLSAGAVRSSVILSASRDPDGDHLGGGERVKLVAQLSHPNEPDGSSSKPEGPLTRISVTAEAQAIEAANSASVPVAQVVAVGFSTELQGELLITEWCPGESIPRRVLRTLGGDEANAKRLAEQCGTSLAALHRVPSNSIPGLPVLDDAHPYQCYVDDLNVALDELGHSYPTLRYGVWWLARNTPASTVETRLVHGDFRLGNLLVDDDGLSAILDWELAHGGDPMCDLAWLCLRTWRFGIDDREVGGFGHLRHLQDAYSEAGGAWNSERFAWWTVARTVWWGAGLASQAKAFEERSEAGEPASLVHAASGRRVVELEYDLLKLIGELDGL